MKPSRFASAAFIAFLLNSTPLHAAGGADMGEVGDYMSRMLQNMHFERPPFVEMSQRFVDDFLAELDPQRLFFVQSDVDAFNKDYGDDLASLLLTGEGPHVAETIHGIYRKRVEARVAETKRLLASETFDFSAKEFVARDRKNASWPKDEKDAMNLWKAQVKEALLSEKLRQDLVDKRAKEQKTEVTKDSAQSIKDKILVRHERLLHRVTQDTTESDMAAMLFSTVARAFDPHSDYMKAPEMGRFKDELRNELVGIGAQLLSEESGGTKIAGIILGGPADKQGKLKVDDSIVAVDPDGLAGPEPMVDVMFMDSVKVVELIRGDAGTTVALKVSPPAGAAVDADIIEITRGKVELKASLASAQIIQTKGEDGETAKLGIITLPSFYVDFDGKKAGCSDDIESLLVRLNEEKIDGLILDIRGNGGGSLPEVQRMTGLFAGNVPVTQVKNTVGKIEVLHSGVRAPIYTGPMIVMTDKGSASASEILAGALQDLNRAVIVGQSSTFGKGTVQKTLDIAPHMPLFATSRDAGTLKLTIQKFYRPSGSSTQNKGVVPDIVLPAATDAYEFGEAFMPHSLKHDFIRAAATLKAQDRNQLFLPRLKELSDARVKESKDFAWLSDDIAKARQRISENRISLNEEERQKESEETETQQRERNADREKRFAVIREADSKTMKFYDLSLEDVIARKPLVEVDPSKSDGKYIKMSKEKVAGALETVPWPSGLDLQKREGLRILQDMVTVDRNARMAGIFKEQNVR